MTKIVFDSDEKIYLEGSVSFFKGFNTSLGTAYLTSKRLVLCKRSGFFFFLLGPILIYLTKGKNIVFEVLLRDIHSLGKSKHGLGSKYTIKNYQGEEFALQFIKQEKWLTSIQQAVKQQNPMVQINAIGDLIEFNYID